MGKTSKRTWGRSGLLTQWIIKYGYLPIILIGMVGLALDIGTREWKSDDVIVADAPAVAAPSVVAEAPVVAETFVERRPPTVEIKVEPKPTMQLTAPVMAEDLVEPPPPTMETKVEPKPTYNWRHSTRMFDCRRSPINRRRRATSCTPICRRIGRRCHCQTASAPPALRTLTTFAPRSSRQQSCSMSTFK